MDTRNQNRKSQKAETFSAFFDMNNRKDPPLFEKHLRPYRSLSKDGFVLVIALISVGFLIPLLAFLGTAVLWGLLPFMLLCLSGVYFGFMQNYRQSEMFETMRLWRDMIAVHRFDPPKQDRFWSAHPNFVKIHLHKNHEVENYLTLTGGHREIELGRFLTADERLALYKEISENLSRATQIHHD